MAYFTNAIFNVDNTLTDWLWTCMVPGERPSDRPYFQVRRGGKLPSTRESGVSPVVRPLSVPAYLTEPFVGPSVGCCQKRIWIGNLWRKAPSFQIIFLSELFQLGIVHGGGGAHARLFHTHRGRTKTVKPFSPPPRWTPTKQNKSGER